MMKFLSSLTLLAGSVGLLSNPALAQDAEIGSVQNHTFRTAPTNSMGVKSLKELRGKPVLIEFWGTR